MNPCKRAELTFFFSDRKWGENLSHDESPVQGTSVLEITGHGFCLKGIRSEIFPKDRSFFYGFSREDKPRAGDNRIYVITKLNA